MNCTSPMRTYMESQELLGKVCERKKWQGFVSALIIGIDRARRKNDNSQVFKARGKKIGGLTDVKGKVRKGTGLKVTR